MSLTHNESIRIDKIRSYYTSNSDVGLDLTDKDKEILKRWQRADFLFHQYKDRRKVVSWLIKEFEISERQAYADISNSMTLFSRTRNIDKNYMIAINIEDTYKDIEQARQDRDWKSVASLTKLLNEMLKAFENPDTEERKPKIIVIGNFRECLPYEIPENFEAELNKLRVKKHINITPDAEAEFEG